jgi:rhodanese-related sulfurtransferase
MKKLAYLFFIAALVVTILPVAPTVAQSDAVVSRLETYNDNLPSGYGVLSLENFLIALAEGEDLTVLDVREPGELEERGRLDLGEEVKMVHIPMRSLGENLDLLPDLDASIVVVCQGGFRATYAMTALHILGYENAQVLKGGFGGWTDEDMPVTMDPIENTPAEAPEFDEEVFNAVNDYMSNLPEGWAAVRADGLAVELIEEPPILLDVRSQEEFDAGYIEGAEHIWIDNLMDSRDMWPEDKDANIVIYCGSSYRAGIGAVMMELMGYSNVRNLVGGIKAWVASGQPLEGAPAEAVAADDEARESGGTDPDVAAAEEFGLADVMADYVEGLPGNFNAIRAEDLAEQLEAGEDILLLDVRNVTDYTEGHIDGAINVPIEQVTANLDLLPDLEQRIVVYCGSGHRSAMIMVALNLLGYENAESLLDGQRAWLASDLPVTDELVDYEGGTAPEFDPTLFEIVDAYVSNIPQGFYAVGAQDLAVELIEGETPPVLIDVRTSGEWENGYIEGAIHLELREMMNNLEVWPEDTSANVVFYGSTTHRGAMAMTMMRLMGYDNVRSLAGGTGAWENAGQVLVTE